MSNTIRPENECVLAIWRVGLAAYREAARRTVFPSEHDAAGKAAILAAFPELSPQEASRHLIQAVAWASDHHHEWLNRGAMKREWIWPRDHRGVGYHRNPGYEPDAPLTPGERAKVDELHCQAERAARRR